jgi:hypothetical protein
MPAEGVDAQSEPEEVGILAYVAHAVRATPVERV